MVRGAELHALNAAFARREAEVLEQLRLARRRIEELESQHGEDDRLGTAQADASEPTADEADSGGPAPTAAVPDWGLSRIDGALDQVLSKLDALAGSLDRQAQATHDRESAIVPKVDALGRSLELIARTANSHDSEALGRISDALAGTREHLAAMVEDSRQRCTASLESVARMVDRLVVVGELATRLDREALERTGSALLEATLRVDVIGEAQLKLLTGLQEFDDRLSKPIATLARDFAERVRSLESELSTERLRRECAESRADDLSRELRSTADELLGVRGLAESLQSSHRARVELLLREVADSAATVDRYRSAADSLRLEVDLLHRSLKDERISNAARLKATDATHEAEKAALASRIRLLGERLESLSVESTRQSIEHHELRELLEEREREASGRVGELTRQNAMIGAAQAACEARLRAADFEAAARGAAQQVLVRRVESLQVGLERERNRRVAGVLRARAVRLRRRGRAAAGTDASTGRREAELAGTPITAPSGDLAAPHPNRSAGAPALSAAAKVDRNHCAKEPT
jgi:hypothetical protein